MLGCWGTMVPMAEDMTLIEVDERGRTSLGRLHPAAGRYLGEVQSDGTVVLHPATLMTAAQARLLARPDIMEAVDKLAADPSAGVRRGRPRRKQA
jgi:hypothetical protein